MNHPTLFDLVNPEPAVQGMVRGVDHQTSVDAARAVEPKRSALHQQILDAFAQHGEMNDEQLENLPQFANYAPSTIRKRRSELYLEHRALTIVRDEPNSRGQMMHVWGLA